MFFLASFPLLGNFPGALHLANFPIPLSWFRAASGGAISFVPGVLIAPDAEILACALKTRGVCWRGRSKDDRGERAVICIMFQKIAWRLVMTWQNAVQFFHSCVYRLDFDFCGSYWSAARKCRFVRIPLGLVAYASATVCVSEQLGLWVVMGLTMICQIILWLSVTLKGLV